MLVLNSSPIKPVYIVRGESLVAIVCPEQKINVSLMADNDVFFYREENLPENFKNGLYKSYHDKLKKFQ